jgi:hypothetical protein
MQAISVPIAGYGKSIDITGISWKYNKPSWGNPSFFCDGFNESL